MSHLHNYFHIDSEIRTFVNTLINNTKYSGFAKLSSDLFKAYLYVRSLYLEINLEENALQEEELLKEIDDN